MKASVQKSIARILMVDDVGSGLLARKSVLEDLGHKITIASTPSDAMEQFGKHPFDIVVTDFKMPSMNGIELIARLRKIRHDIPVILISGFTDALGLDEATTGADAVIQKSAQEVAQLIRCVNRLLRRPPRKPADSAVSKAKARNKTA
jgi:CheY-like chemotaxis protein